jgi:hypothetical protein
MCLACEMDALWFAEMEAARATTPGSAGVAPALSDEASAYFDEIDPSRGDSAPSPHQRGEVQGVGGTPTVAASRFLCEETRSE